VFDEPGSDHAAELWDRADLVVSGLLVYPEARAAMAAAHRSGRIDEAAYEAAITAVEELYAELRIIAVDEPLARHAGDLAAEHSLRGYDAVHLACALAIDAEDVLLATWDAALGDAAHETGRLLVNQR
jgi:predicted nucleic acid-binding protein